MTSTERIEAVLSHVGLKAPTFASEIGVKYQRILDIQIGKTKSISSTVASLIVDRYAEIDINWLLTGEGSMLRQPTPLFPTISGVEITDEEEYAKAQALGLTLVPMYDQEFRGGERGELLGVGKPTGYWHIPDSKGSFIVNVSGDSMYPVIPSGARVVLRSIGFDPASPLSIPFGNIFAVSVADETTEEVVGHIKYIRRHPDPKLARQYWIARSENADKYDDFEIAVSSVRGLWVVEYILSKQF